MGTISGTKILILPKIFPTRFRFTLGGSYGNKILYKSLDLTQDFPNTFSFHFLWVKSKNVA